MKKELRILLTICSWVLFILPAHAQDSLPIPDYETTFPAGWIDTTLLFDVTLHTFDDCADFTLRVVKEEPFASGYDTCWFPGVPVDYYQWGQAMNKQAFVFSNSYSDQVGWTKFGVTYYRLQRAAAGLPMPCGFTAFQQMSIDDDLGGFTPYAWNVLTADIGVTYVCSSRAGVGGCRPW